MPKTVFDVLKDNIDKESLSAKEFLVGGSPKDYPDYRESVGYIRGLERGKQTIEDLQRQYMKEEENE